MHGTAPCPHDGLTVNKNFQVYRLIEFIRRSYVTILFVALEIVAISFYARSNYYTQARILARANAVNAVCDMIEEAAR